MHRFVERVVARCKPKAILLYGSVVRGEATATSDIDVCVLLEDERDKDAVYSAASEVNDELTSNGIKNLLTPTILTREEEIPIEFLEEGVTLWGSAIRVMAAERGLKPMVLIAYDMSGLEPSEKARVSHVLHGHVTKKTYKGKTYTSSSEGLLKVLGAKRIGNALLLEREKKGAIDELFRKCGVKYEKVDVYG